MEFDSRRWEAGEVLGADAGGGGSVREKGLSEGWLFSYAAAEQDLGYLKRTRVISRWGRGFKAWSIILHVGRAHLLHFGTGASVPSFSGL